MMEIGGLGLLKLDGISAVCERELANSLPSRPTESGEFATNLG